jgi:hypothetical protein
MQLLLLWFTRCVIALAVVLLLRCRVLAHCPLLQSLFYSSVVALDFSCWLL